MRKYLFTMLSIFLFFPLSLKAQSDVVVINKENFPDNAFRTKIGSATYDRDGNGVLDAAEIARIHQLDLSGSWPNYIADLSFQMSTAFQ